MVDVTRFEAQAKNVPFWGNMVFMRLNVAYCIDQQLKIALIEQSWRYINAIRQFRQSA